jgi:hypothetical protein
MMMHGQTQIKNGLKFMNSFKECSWKPKYDFGRKSKRKPRNREAEIQKEQVRKCVKQKGTSEETIKGAWEDKAATGLVGRHPA